MSGAKAPSGDISDEVEALKPNDPQSRSRSTALPPPKEAKSRFLTDIGKERRYHPNTREPGACWGPRRWVRNDSIFRFAFAARQGLEALTSSESLLIPIQGAL